MRKMMIALGLALLLSGSAVMAASESDMQAQIDSLQAQLNELKAQQAKSDTDQRTAELLNELAANPNQQAQNTGITAGYDQRFFIRSADDSFSLNFDTLGQIRYSYARSDDGNDDLLQDGTREDPFVPTRGIDPDNSAFELERARVTLIGHVLKDLEYLITLEGDSDRGESGDFVYEYWVRYPFMKELGVGAGKVKMPFGKQNPNSSSGLMLVDRSLADTVFNIDRSTGAEIYGTLDFGDVAQPFYRLGVYNGFRNNERVPFEENDNSPALAARLAVPLGGATVNQFQNESDIENHENMVAMIGGSAAYTDDTVENNAAGGDGRSYTFLAKDLTTDRTRPFLMGGKAFLLGADASLKYAGLSVTGEGFAQFINTDAQDLDPTDAAVLNGRNFDNYGWYVQAGYFIVPKTFELAGRVGGVVVDDSQDAYEYAGGWNWYLSKSQDLKLSMDLTYIDHLPMQSTTTNYYGVQGESLWLLRSQLQFMF